MTSPVNGDKESAHPEWESRQPGLQRLPGHSELRMSLLPSRCCQCCLPKLPAAWSKLPHVELEFEGLLSAESLSALYFCTRGDCLQCLIQTFQSGLSSPGAGIIREADLDIGLSFVSPGSELAMDRRPLAGWGLDWEECYYKCAPLLCFCFFLRTGQDVYKKYWNGSVMHSGGREAV